MTMRCPRCGCENRTGAKFCNECAAPLSAAIALYRAMDMTFWLPQAEAALAQVKS